jgi:hypothetical protein
MANLVYNASITINYGLGTITLMCGDSVSVEDQAAAEVLVTAIKAAFSELQQVGSVTVNSLNFNYVSDVVPM